MLLPYCLIIELPPIIKRAVSDLVFESNFSVLRIFKTETTNGRRSRLNNKILKSKLKNLLTRLIWTVRHVKSQFMLREQTELWSMVGHYEHSIHMYYTENGDTYQKNAVYMQSDLWGIIKLDDGSDSELISQSFKFCCR